MAGQPGYVYNNDRGHPVKRQPGFVYVKSPSGLVIPFKPPALDYVSAAGRESDRAAADPPYLLTTPRQAYEGRIHVADDGEPELWLCPVEPILEPEVYTYSDGRTIPIVPKA